MIWSDECIDPTAGFVINPDKSATPNKLGYWVLTTEEAQQIIKERGVLK